MYLLIAYERRLATLIYVGEILYFYGTLRSGCKSRIIRIGIVCIGIIVKFKKKLRIVYSN